MKSSRTITLTAGVLLVLCMLGSVLFLQRLDRIRTGATLDEVLYITSPKALKRLSLATRGYWPTCTGLARCSILAVIIFCSAGDTSCSPRCWKSRPRSIRT